MRKIFITLLAIISLTASAQTFEIDFIRYQQLTSNTVSVKKYTVSGDEKSITIPSTVDYNGVTYSVVAIEEDAFYATNVSYVNIPGSVTEIKKCAFQKCSKLTGVSFSSGIKVIGPYAFNGTAITQLSLPNTVEVIDEYAFASCEKLYAIKFPYSSLETIGASAFYNCTNLTSINIPKSVKTLGNRAFRNCLNLEAIRVEWDTPLEITDETFVVSGNFAWYYPNAILYVPTPSYNLYYSNIYWRQFAIAVSSYNCTQVDLTVKVNSQFITKLPIYSGRNYKLQIPDNYVSVTFNGQDVTSEVRGDLCYITPIIEGIPTLEITTNDNEADVNKDGEVNSLDVLKVYKYMQSH